MERIVSAIFDEISTALARGDRGTKFWRISVKTREARTGPDPHADESVSVARKFVLF